MQALIVAFIFGASNAFEIIPTRNRPSSYLIKRHDQCAKTAGGLSHSSHGHFTFALHAFRQGAAASDVSQLEVLDEVGSGSYGTVHLLRLHEVDKEVLCIGKRAWSEQDLKLLQPDASNQKERSQRCRTYWETEVHCLKKLQQQADEVPGIPNLRATLRDDKEGHEWMVFDLIAQSPDGIDDTSEPAMSLQDLMELDQVDHRMDGTHHLHLLSQALGINQLEGTSGEEDDEDADSIARVLDVVFQRLLETLSHIHSHGIVHRDIKPANVLVTGDQQLHVIDFGSAADLDTAGPLRKNIGLSERVAISPIYTAPEIFIEPSRRESSLSFDCFSVALLICQLLFQYLDERTDAGFHQQLQAAKWNLNAWLATELAGKVRPAGMDDALRVLSRRPGLWSLLQDMLRPDPWERTGSKSALKRLTRIVEEAREREDAIVDSFVISETDGAYLADVLESLDFCEVPLDYGLSAPPLTVRPLHFVATFKRNEPLGLLLAEPAYVIVEEEFEDDHSRQQWQRATAGALDGEVYLQGVVPGSQADILGVFEVGDRIQGVGELPLADQGFDRVVQMIQEDTTPDPQFITLHFDRKGFGVSGQPENQAQISPSLFLESPIDVVDQAAWSSKGRRKAQEDRFILHELHDSNGQSILLAGVFDGHLGTAASDTAQEMLPSMMTQELLTTRGENNAIETMLESAWETVCSSYRSQCGMNQDDSCRVADYDPREGVLDANTGSSEVVAGTTANVIALDKQTGRMSVLNVGDSRSFVVSENREVVFESVDHKPELELQRFLDAQKTQPSSLYKTPQCRFSRWFVPVGDYEYAVSRSLEGPFATARGIVSDADVSVLQAEPGCTIFIATDGLQEVMSTAEVARIVHSMRFNQGSSAADTAKTLCSMAIQRGSTDNVSVVVLFCG